MDENAQSFSSIYSQQESTKIYLPKPSNSTSSGITLVLPSLKSLKASQALNKAKLRSPATPQSLSHFRDVDIPERKAPRPVKLKPLKEVLTKLINQIKKKDDYAFFLTPVDVNNVPGYTDIVKQPMDLGTMTDKVNRGKYRSLEDFAADLKLVTNNAKLFNPPGSIYYTEADRIEAWGLDHITKAAPTVIQYETDWNIDIEKDEEPTAINVEDDDDGATGTPMAVDQPNLRERSGSVMSQQPTHTITSRRGPRGPYKKHGHGQTLSESLEADGGLPGSKDGLGAFPSGSDWARTMLSLKLKGKRYKTKKERLKIERDGPPLLPDGSLDYTEMEDPFSVLSFFVPDPPTRPHLIPLYPPLNNPPQPTHSQQAPSDPSSSYQPGPSTSQAPSTIRQSLFPSATSLPLERNPLHLPILQLRPDTSGNSSGNQAAQTSSQTPSHAQPPRRRHWNIIRNANSRQKGKEKEDEQESGELPAWQVPREPHAVDFGSFSLLSAELAEEMQRRRADLRPLNTASSVPGPAETMTQTSAPGTASTSAPSLPNAQKIADDLDQWATIELIKNSLDVEAVAKKTSVEDAHSNIALLGPNTKQLGEGYWTNQRAAEAEAYLRDMVYGGVEGYAYVRSLAEFVNGDVLLDEEDRSRERTPSAALGGLSLAKWVEQNIVDPLTDGRHSLLRESALALARQSQRDHDPGSSSMYRPAQDNSVEKQVAASLHVYPAAVKALSALLQIRHHKIDMGSLIKSPDELFLSEEEWAGKGLKEKRRAAGARSNSTVQAGVVQANTGASESQDVKMEVDGDSTTSALMNKADPMEVEEPEQTWAGVSAEVLSADTVKERANNRLANYELEGPEELNEVLEYVASAIIELDRRNREALANKSHKRTDGSSLNGSAHDSTVPTAAKGERNGSDVTHEMSPQPPATNDGDHQPTSSSLATTMEDTALRNLRLNLLALAKRAPLDTIARLPRDLVPEHIRHFVPTLGST
ncbi:hypothetical protein CVT24_009629 [Panaeolus cyanescens]|uniref:Bromo domain-containing protein n=1 Tax=Panaeolus cyanescens TaxID=181874 RepID=A0A409YA05_9AGAR|nr:hypothetical protein CVT24_009629 [Panaeolus cyanescens]